jgi:chromosome segregation ATPase
MNFRGLIKRAEEVDKAVQDLQFELADQDLQIELADALGASLDAEDLASPKSDDIPGSAAGPDDSPAEANAENGDGAKNAGSADDTDSSETAPRLTPHTQTRLAALSAFEGLFHDARDYLDEINGKLSEIATSHHLTREFLNILHNDILRANELELANAGLGAEQRTLSEKLQDAVRKLREREGAVEALQQRETSLVQDREALRAALAAVRLELVETANASAKRDAEFGDIAKRLTGRTVEANRRLRESKMLREKHVSLSIELDKALKRESQARHRLDELSTIHASEAARLADLLAALGKSEKEQMRLQKSLEAAQAKLSEMNEATRMTEGDREAELARSQAEMRGLRSEIEDLRSRLEQSSNENSEAASEIARLKAELNDTLAEKKIADERLSALTHENENDRMSLSKANADLSQLTLQQASEQIQLDVQRQECDDLRAEIVSLNARVKELLPYERLHKATNGRPREDGVVEIAAVMAKKARATGRRRIRRNVSAAS